MKKRLAVFVSGNGSDLQSIIDDINANKINAQIVLCISSKTDAYALTRARNNGILSLTYKTADFKSPDMMFREMYIMLEGCNIDYIVLAGYLTILPEFFVKRFAGKIINIHPALLPKYGGKGYYGMAVHNAVIASGDTESGATVHFVDEGIDTGEIIMQEKIPVLSDDTAETLQARVLELEHTLLPKAIAKLCE